MGKKTSQTEGQAGMGNRADKEEGPCFLEGSRDNVTEMNLRHERKIGGNERMVWTVFGTPTTPDAQGMKQLIEQI